MKKITAIALLYAIAMPAFATDGSVTTKPEADALRNATLNKIRAKADQLSTFSLLESKGNFSLYGKLSIPRLTTSDEFGMQHKAVSYGLHGQLGSVPGIGPQKMGLRFGWNRYLAGPNAGDNLYSLTAEVKF